MRSSAVQRLARRYLLPHLPGFQSKGSLVLFAPVAEILRGFAFESSSFDQSTFYIWAFAQPLYVPRFYLCYDIGIRVRNSQELWTITPDDEADVMRHVLSSIHAQGLPFLEKFASPADVASNAVVGTGVHNDPHVDEVVAYSLALSGDRDKALAAIRRLQRSLAKLDPSLEWPREMAARAQHVEDALTYGLERASALLLSWALVLGELQFPLIIREAEANECRRANPVCPDRGNTCASQLTDRP